MVILSVWQTTVLWNKTKHSSLRVKEWFVKIACLHTKYQVQTPHLRQLRDFTLWKDKDTMTFWLPNQFNSSNLGHLDTCKWSRITTCCRIGWIQSSLQWHLNITAALIIPSTLNSMLHLKSSSLMQEPTLLQTTSSLWASRSLLCKHLNCDTDPLTTSK